MTMCSASRKELPEGGSMAAARPIVSRRLASPAAPSAKAVWRKNPRRVPIRGDYPAGHLAKTVRKNSQQNLSNSIATVRRTSGRREKPPPTGEQRHESNGDGQGD